MFKTRKTPKIAPHPPFMELASLTDADLRLIFESPMALMTPGSRARQLSHAFRIMGRYRTIRHFNYICAAIVLLSLPLDRPEAPLAFAIGRIGIALIFCAGALGLRQPRGILSEAFCFAGPLVVLLAGAGLVPLIYDPAQFRNLFDTALLPITAGLSLLQFDLLALFGLAATLAAIAAALVVAAPAPALEKAQLLVCFLATLIAVCNARRIVMYYRGANILNFYRGELQNRMMAGMANQLKAFSETDQLTGLGNRRHFEEARLRVSAEHEIAILMIDIDRFKTINDELGHLEGDRCLREVADAIRASLRATDVVSRYGGEEFAVLVTLPPLGAASALAERIRVAVQAKVRSARGPVTVSIGIAGGTGGYYLEVLRLADAALYRAKALGRNRVESMEHEADRDASSAESRDVPSP